MFDQTRIMSGSDGEITIILNGENNPTKITVPEPNTTPILSTSS